MLSAIFSTAFNDQITTLNPCAGIKAPTVPPATRRIITPEQFAVIHQALPTDEVRLLVETDVETGLRWGELVELRVRDLDLPHGLLAVSRIVIEIPANSTRPASGSVRRNVVSEAVVPGRRIRHRRGRRAARRYRRLPVLH